MRRSYDRQFKMTVVKLVFEDNMSVSEVSKELSIHYNSLYRWINEYEEYGESAFPGHGSALYNSQYEIKKLKKFVSGGTPAVVKAVPHFDIL